MTQLDWGFDQEEVTYPDDWPDVPEGFELEETTNFRGGGDEFVFTSDLLDLRISRHDDVISATARVRENFRDYRWESEEKAVSWLSDLFELYEKSVGIKIETVDPIERIVGVSEDYSLMSCNSPDKGLFDDYEGGLVENYDDLTEFGKYRNWDIHNPESVGDLKLIVSFQNNRDVYMYVFENHIIDIHTFDAGKDMDAFAVPTYEIIFEYLNQYNSEHIKLLYLNDSICKEDVLKRFI
jgi:hypothetical protein